MKQIKQRLYSIYLLVVAAFIFLLYFLLTQFVEERIFEQQESYLSEEITSLIAYVRNQAGAEDFDQADVITSLNNVSFVVNERITFIDLDGNPLFDSELTLQKLRDQNLLEQIEMQQVLYGEDLGVSVRESSLSEKEQYFIAQVIRNDRDEPIGIIRLSSDVNDIRSVIDQVLMIQILGMVALAAVFVYLTSHWINNITKAITNMEDTVTKLTESDYDARYAAHTFEELNQLGYSINRLALNLTDQQAQLESSEERTHGLINHLIIGVLLLDEERRIQMVNPVMNELLGVNLYGKISHLYTDYVNSSELIELIEEAYSVNEAVNAEIRTYFPEERRLDVNIVPVPGAAMEETHFIVLLYDISEIRRLEKVRADFATNVSHELRTPITALKGFSETLLDGAMYEEDVLKEFLEIMLSESTRLDAMVQEILQLSRLEQGHERFSQEWIVVRDVVEEVFQILQQKIILKKIQVRIKEKEQVTIRANRNHLKQILMNLLANAISYTPEQGEVIVTLNQLDEKAFIQVTDNGIGIPLKDQQRIFERFYRVDKARSRNAGGTGLGLAIVKWVVDSMDGKIELFSAPGKGTTFVVSLPVDNRDSIE